LGICQVFARSPEAKGRVERMAGTFQDRLVSELRLAGATTIADANRVLWDFLPRFNEHFGVPPAQSGGAYRPVEPDLDLATILCFKHDCRIARDNTVKYRWRTHQLLPDSDRRSYTGVRAEVQVRLDGNLVVFHQGRVIPSREAPPRAGVLRSSNSTWSGQLPTLPKWLTDDYLYDTATCLTAKSSSNESDVPGRRPTPRQQARWDVVQEAKNRGLSQRATARLLGMSRKTVRRYKSAISPPLNRPLSRNA